ncbi:MAG: HAMP domain-containing protein [Asticcacaulis sp.]
MSIRSRILMLVGCFALMAFTVTGLGLMTISGYNRMIKDYDHAYDNAWRGEHFNHLITKVVMETRGQYNITSQNNRMVFVNGLINNLNELETFTAEWQAHANPAEKAQIDSIAAHTKGFIALRRRVAALAASGDIVAAEALSVSNRPDRIAFQTHVAQLIDSTRVTLIAAKAKADNYSHRRAGDFLLTALIGIAIMMAISLWIVAHFITNPLRNLASAIIKTSKGDYDVPIDDGNGKDEVASVWQALAILKERSIEAEQLAAAKAKADHEKEMKLREIMLD